MLSRKNFGHLFYSFAYVIFLFLISCSKVPEPPVKLSFEIEKFGGKAETVFQIKEKRTYVFNLRFLPNKKNAADRERLKSLIGDNSGPNKGVPTPISMKIWKNGGNGETLIWDRNHDDLMLRSWGAGFDKNIADITLSSGKYRISIVSQKDNPVFVENKVQLVILEGQK